MGTFLVLGKDPIVSFWSDEVTEVLGAVEYALIDGRPSDGFLVKRGVDGVKRDRCPMIVSDLLFVLVYNVPVLVEARVPVGSKGFVVS
jgi:hypothetical protein